MSSVEERRRWLLDSRPLPMWALFLMGGGLSIAAVLNDQYGFALLSILFFASDAVLRSLLEKGSTPSHEIDRMSVLASTRGYGAGLVVALLLTAMTGGSSGASHGLLLDAVEKFFVSLGLFSLSGAAWVTVIVSLLAYRLVLINYLRAARNEDEVTP